MVLWTLEATSGKLNEPQLDDVPKTPVAATKIVAPEFASTPTLAPTSKSTSTPTFQPTLVLAAQRNLELTPEPTYILLGDIDETLEEPPPEDKWTIKDDDDEIKSRESWASLVAERGYGYQSNIGPTYAGAMVYDFSRHSVYLTGSSYGHVGHHHHGVERFSAHCFLIHLQMVRYQPKHLRSANETVEDLVQSCNSVTQGENHLFLAGIKVHDPTKSIYSIMTHLERSQNQPEWTPIPDGDNWLQEDTVPIGYPISILIDDRIGIGGDSVFVLTLQSFDTRLNEYYATHYDPDAPNLTPGGGIKYGDNYHVALHHYHSSNDPSQKKMTQQWQRVFEINDDVTARSFIKASGVIQLRDTLYVAGSLQGTLKGVSLMNETSLDDRGVDGFVIAVKADEGAWLEVNDDPSRRFDSIDHRDDWIHNICASSGDDDYLYIVGATKGDFGAAKPNGGGRVDPFVAKLETQTLKTVWVHQFHTSSASFSSVEIAPASAVAYGCTVVSHEGIIYVAGVVENDATIDGQTKSHGGDDIFVARLDASTGKVRWLRQVGSSGKENLARSRGIVADMDSNAVIYGDTTGELFRDRSLSGQTSDMFSSDIFVMTLEKSNGSNSQTIESIKFELWFGIISVVIVCLSLGGLCYYHRRGQRQYADQSKYFPRYDSGGVHDEEEMLVPGWAGQMELVESSSLGLGSGEVDATRGLDDFMPQYYKKNQSRSGRSVI